MADVKNFEINEQELEGIAGGGKKDGGDYLYDLGNFMVRHVHGVVQDGNTSCLTMRKVPNGEVISGYGWQNGDDIMVHSFYKEGGWLFAYQRGKYGYVDANYVW